MSSKNTCDARSPSSDGPLPFTECALVGVDETGTTGSTSVDGTPLDRELGYPRLVSYVPSDAPIVYFLPNGPRELRDGDALLEVGAGRGRACGEVPHSRLSGQAHEAPVARHGAAGDARRGIPDRRALTDRGTGALMSSNILRTSMSWPMTCSSSRTTYWPIAHTATVTSERSAKNCSDNGKEALSPSTSVKWRGGDMKETGKKLSLRENAPFLCCRASSLVKEIVENCRGQLGYFAFFYGRGWNANVDQRAYDKAGEISEQLDEMLSLMKRDLETEACSMN